MYFSVLIKTGNLEYFVGYHLKGVHYQKCTIIANFRKIQKAGPYTVLYKIRMVLKHKST